MRKHKFSNGLGMLGLAGAAVIAAAPSAQAGMFTIADSNSYADFDTESQAGMYNWVVDGVDHMFQQWFWFRTGNMENEASVNMLAIAAEGTTDTDFDGDDDTLYVRYTNQMFDIELRFTILGGSNGSGISDIAEQIAIHNRTSESLSMSFFQYNDADLNAGSTDTGVQIFNTPAGSASRQSDAGATLHETVVTPRPTHYEANTFPNTIVSLNDGAPTTLNDNDSILGPGDYTWAFQWDFVLQGVNRDGDSYIISKDKQIAAVPAPGALLLGAMGMGLVGWFKRRNAVC